MKRICLLLVLFLAFSACGKHPNELTAAKASNATLEVCGENDYFRADEDFIETNFGQAPYWQDSAVYLSNRNDGSEFGFFELTDIQYRDEMIAAIRAYLASEEQSVRALATLYPADDLKARLDRFEKATVGAAHNVVYYFLTDVALAQKAERAFQ